MAEAVVVRESKYARYNRSAKGKARLARFEATAARKAYKAAWLKEYRMRRRELLSSGGQS